MFVIFDKHTTRILTCRGINRERYCTEAVARSVFTKAVKNGFVKNPENYEILSTREFSKIEKMETVYSLMTGAPIVQSVNTPLCCDPSSETYWSM